MKNHLRTTSTIVGWRSHVAAIDIYIDLRVPGRYFVDRRNAWNALKSFFFVSGPEFTF